ncbi:MAG: ABC transporter [Alphaproteobacteria bacterium]|nr:MAG: ABC transporter [Alphaproteobacteria bacterium]
MRRRPRAAFAALVLVLALGGCGTAPPIPRDHFYRLAIDTTTVRTSPSPVPGIVSVNAMKADGLLRERPVLYSTSGGPHEMQQHDYHYWTEPPPRMLQGFLVDYLRASGFAEAVVTPELRIRPDYQISGRIKRFERLLGGKTPRIAAVLELAMIEAHSNRLVVVGTYAAERAVRDDSVESSVYAFNEAVSDILARFVADASRRELAFRTAARK